MLWVVVSLRTFLLCFVIDLSEELTVVLRRSTFSGDAFSPTSQTASWCTCRLVEYLNEIVYHTPELAKLLSWSVVKFALFGGKQ